MTDVNDVTKLLLDNIAEAASESKEFTAEARARALRDLAEALAWIVDPRQPHGAASGD
jgi:hypothetical protein